MAYLPDGQCRVLIAPCGCFGAGDISDDIPGFGRTIDMAREDIRDGFTETQTTIEEWRAKSVGCTHTPKWRAPMTRQTVPDVWHEAGHHVHFIRGGRFVCTAAQFSPCRNYPACECEYPDPTEHGKPPTPGHEDVPQSTCWLESWLTGVDLCDTYSPEQLTQDDDTFPDGPIRIEWFGDEVTWEYADDTRPYDWCATGDHYATLAPPEPGCPPECQGCRDSRAQALTEARFHAANVGDE